MSSPRLVRGASVAVSFLAFGCALEDAPPPPVRRIEVQKAPELQVTIDDGAPASTCPPDLDGGVFLCALYCPPELPNCGKKGNACNPAWDVDQNGQVEGQDCQDATDSYIQCDLCCDMCSPNAGARQLCQTGCQLNGGFGGGLGGT